MESHLVPGDPILVENIVNYLKAMGIFDEFRHECLADVDTKSSCQNLSQRVDGYTSKFLANEIWNPDLNKNEVRNKLRKHIDESGMLSVGVDHVVEQVINPKVHQLFLPKIIEVVHQYLDKEKEKLNKKQEITNSEKISTEAIPKTKTTVLDPIADILSFTCSKPKPVVSIPIQNAQAKGSEASKVEKKKEEVSHQPKTPDQILKTEKKKEELVQSAKSPDVLPKIKKEEVVQSAKSPDVLPKIKKEEVVQSAKSPDVLPKIKKEDVVDMTSAVDNTLISEKKEEISSPIKTVTVESPKELIKPIIPIPQTKNLNDCKEIEKVLKPVKMKECEAFFETPKKTEKEDIKPEKKKVENLKLQTPEKLPQSEENSKNKSSSVKSSSSSKSKLESDKHKRNKPLGLGVVKPSSKVSESHKSTVRESSDSSPDKVSTDQSKVSAKLPNVHTKDRSSLKNTISTKMVKGGDSVSKSKSKGTPTKTSDKPVSLKVSSLKKDNDSVKMKHSLDKHEKTKPLKISDAKIQSESSSSSDKGSRQSSHYSSSYDSSQGSDPDRSSSSVSSKEKLKHFSKHQRKDSYSTDKPSSSKRCPQSDSGTPKKDKDENSSKDPTEEQNKSFTVQESAKITSRSDSIGSSASTSDSQSSLKEASISISSEETSNSSTKSLKKKKQASKDKEPCSGSKNLPPPSPPPPTSGVSTNRASSVELSSLDETRSSQESELESSDDNSSDSDEDNSCSSSSNEELSLKPTEFVGDVPDIFLFSSSSSDFEGFNSSPEKAPKNFASDVSVSSVHTSDLSSSSVSSVHTSDLSSFEDELSDVECSNDQPVEGKSKKRFTIKEAQEILKAMAEQQRLEALKTVPQKALKNKKTPKSIPRNSSAPALSEIKISPPPEPKRESRRERKLNPKYASNEYTSIFDSKRTSFITKQSSQCEVKPTDVNKTESDPIPAKDALSTRRKSSVMTIDKNLTNDVSKVPSEESGKSSISQPSASRVLEFSSEDISSNSQMKTILNTSDKNHKSLAESDSPNRIALKVKLSATKNDNETNKDPNAHGTKRKFKEEDKSSVKRVCQRNSVNANTLESIVNENKPFNSKSKHPSAVLSVSQSNDKEVFLKQKVNNNGDVLNKIELVMKNSHSKSNHINEKQSDD